MRKRKKISENYLVSTILTPDERLRVDAAGTGFYRTCHRNRVREVLTDVCRHHARAIVVSVRRYEQENDVNLHRVISGIPQIPTVALLSTMTADTPHALLRLGNEGIRRVIDVRLPGGWDKLREYLARKFPDPVERYAMVCLQRDGLVPGTDSWVFFSTLFRTSREIASVRTLAEGFSLFPSTLMSRFYRAGLPAPKRYLAIARLVRAAFLFENWGFSVGNVADHLEYSSPQSFGRHIRSMIGMTAVGFRRRYTGAQMMAVFEKDLILPYVRKLRDFHPLQQSLGRSGG